MGSPDTSRMAKRSILLEKVGFALPIGSIKMSSMYWNKTIENLPITGMNVSLKLGHYEPFQDKDLTIKSLVLNFSMIN